MRAAVALALLLVACEDNAPVVDAAHAVDAGVDAAVCSPIGYCALDGECANTSVCATGGVQACTQILFSGVSAECSGFCQGNVCCACCQGWACGPGKLTACGAGSRCMESRDSVGEITAACQTSGADLAGWTDPPDGGHSCI